jgi:TatD DNase family protein
LREGLYDKVKEFIEESKKYIPKVQATIVTHQDGVDEAKCEDMACNEFNIDYRPRRYNIVG